MLAGMFFAKRALKNARGFSFVETLLAGGLTGAVVLGAATMLNNAQKTEKITNVQAIVDREFAAGTQLAANSENLKPFVNAAALGACLTKDGNSNCAAFGGWADYPANPGAGRPKFQLSVNHLKECAASEATCMATRYMRYRWICTASECSGLETEVRITPINAYAQSFKPRVSSVKLDRRQFLTRDQISFMCGTGNTMRGVDYDQLQADCQAIANSNCATPQATLDPASAGNNCHDPLTIACPHGYAITALDNGRVLCRPPSPGRTVAGGATTTGATPGTYAPNGPPPTVTNTVTTTTTVTTTGTATEPAPGGACPVQTFTSEETGATIMKPGLYWCLAGNPEYPGCDPNSMPHKAWVLYTDDCMLQCQSGKIRVVKNGPYPGGGSIGAAGVCAGPEANKKDPLY